MCEQPAVHPETIHDSMEWMDWANDNAFLRDGCSYQAEMKDGSIIDCTAEVHGPEDAWVLPDDESLIDDFDEGDIVCLRWLGF